MASQYFYKQHDREHGPYDAAALKKLAKTGVLKPDDRIRKEGSSQWRLAKEAKGLFGNLSTDHAAKEPNGGEQCSANASLNTPNKDFGAAVVASALIGTVAALCLHAVQWLCGWGLGSLSGVVSSSVLLALGVIPWVFDNEGQKKTAAAFGAAFGAVLGLAYGLASSGVMSGLLFFTSIGTWAAWLADAKGLTSRYSQAGVIVTVLAVFGFLGMLTPTGSYRSTGRWAVGGLTGDAVTGTLQDPSPAGLMVTNTNLVDALRSSLASQGLRPYDATFSATGRFLCLLCKTDKQNFDSYNYSRRTDLFLWNLEKAAACSSGSREEPRLTLPAAIAPEDKELACLDGNELKLWSLGGDMAEHRETISLPEPPSNRGGNEYHWRNWNAVSWRHPDTILVLWQPEAVLGDRSRRAATCIVRRKQGRWAVDQNIYEDSVVSPDGVYAVSDEDLASYDSPYILRVRSTIQEGKENKLELPQQNWSRGMWGTRPLGFWDRSSLGGDMGTAPFDVRERSVAFSSDSSKLIILKKPDDKRSGQAILDVFDPGSCRLLHSRPVPIGAGKSDDAYDTSRFLGTSSDGVVLLGVRTQVTESSRGVEARNNLCCIRLADGKVTQQPINGLRQAFLAHGNSFDGSQTAFAPNIDGSAVWISITPKPADVSDLVGGVKRTTVVSVTNEGAVENELGLAPFVSGEKMVISGDGEWIAGLGGKDLLPCLFRRKEIVGVKKMLEEAEASFNSSEYTKALTLCKDALGSEGFSAVEARREKYVAMSCECLAVGGDTQAALQVLAELDAAQYRWEPQLEATQKLVDNVRAEEQARADAAARESSQREEERVQQVRSSNQAKRIDPRSLSCSAFIAYLDDSKAAGSLMLRGATAIFKDYALTDICGEPKADEEWLESRRLWSYGCKDGVVTFTVMQGEPGTVVVVGVNIVRL
jgi:hypothetical protein